jgi:predicted CXXCH cytochrome family protein
MGHSKRKPAAKIAAKAQSIDWWIPAGIAVALAGLWWGAWWTFHPKIESATFPVVIDSRLRALSSTPPVEGLGCTECHAKEAEEWRQSQHANANRLIDLKIDLPAFNRGQIESANGTRTVLRSELGIPAIATIPPNGTVSIYHPEAVIGVTPLVEYLAAFPGGRLQVLNPAFDPEKKEWFDSQAPEVRLPQDWSHWMNRGMNWNSQCAFCHMTNLNKGYDPLADVYRTTWDAMGISCAQCHGAMTGHAASPRDQKLLNKFSIKQMTENCGSCHARREELTGKFHAGESFADHYRLSLPDLRGLYYADGQVKEEDFEFGSFSMSRMGHKGVSCLDCHNPHSGKLRLPVENNALCMSCHTAPGQRGAIPIDPATHTHHQKGTPGGRCVDCHMPQTRYMVRDPRRDHGFTSPDPVLTKELGVPNSCNRCHADKSTDWSIENTVKWYGEKMERLSRQRARVIARAEKGDPSVLPELLSLVDSEEIAAWRSVLISLLTPWAAQPEARELLEKSLAHESPLVRAATVRVLSNVPGGGKLIQPLCDDPVRLVRLDSIWNLHKERDRAHSSYRELTDYLAAISDQPAGALRQTQLALEEQRIEDALKWSAKAAAWDATSGEGRQIHAVVLNAAGKGEEAIAELRRACELDPKNAEHPFMLALLYGETGKQGEVIVQLKKSVELDPAYGRAWYNLGLAYAGNEELPASVAALLKAEELLPGTPEIPYARATVLARAGQMQEARTAAARAQALGYQPASDFLKQLPQ